MSPWTAPTTSCVTGFGSGPIDFGGGPLTSDSATVFAAKFSSGGYHLWSKRFRSGGGQGNAIAVDGADNVLITGTFQNLVDFGPGPISSAGGDNTDFFLSKFLP